MTTSKDRKDIWFVSTFIFSIIGILGNITCEYLSLIGMVGFICCFLFGDAFDIDN